MSRALKAANPSVVIEIVTDSDDEVPVAAWARNIATTWRTTPIENEKKKKSLE